MKEREVKVRRQRSQPERDEDVRLRGRAWCPCRPPLHTLCHASLLAVPKSPAHAILPFFPVALRSDFRMATLKGQGSQGPRAGISHALQCRGSCEQWGQPSATQTHKAGGRCSLGGQQHSSTAQSRCWAGLRAMSLQDILHSQLAQPVSPGPWGSKPLGGRLKRVGRGLCRQQQKLQGHAPILCSRRKSEGMSSHDK